MSRSSGKPTNRPPIECKWLLLKSHDCSAVFDLNRFLSKCLILLRLKSSDFNAINESNAFSAICIMPLLNSDNVDIFGNMLNASASISVKRFRSRKRYINDGIRMDRLPLNMVNISLDVRRNERKRFNFRSDNNGNDFILFSDRSISMSESSKPAKAYSGIDSLKHRKKMEIKNKFHKMKLIVKMEILTVYLLSYSI